MKILDTERLSLEVTKAADIPALHEKIFSDAEVVRFVFGGKPLSLDATSEFIKNRFNMSGALTGLATLKEKNTGEIIGFSGLNPCQPLGEEDLELGFVLAKSAWGKGYATEIGKAQIEFGFERIGCKRLLAMVDPSNAPSIHVLTKLVMKHKADVVVNERGLRRVYCIEKP